MQDYLFVYGTLKSSFQNEMSELLQSSAEFITNAYLFGSLYEIDNYPGLLLSNDKTQKVFGELYSTIPHSIWATLDEYEGYIPQSPELSEYTRLKTSVFTPEMEYDCYTYVYNKAVDPLKLISTGNY